MGVIEQVPIGEPIIWCSLVLCKQKAVTKLIWSNGTTLTFLHGAASRMV